MAVTVSGTEEFERFAHSRVMSPCSIKSIEKKLNLGAFHDGNPGAADCPSEANFLMAVTVSGTEEFERFAHSRVMSPCSIKSIEKKLKTPSAKCLWKSKKDLHKMSKKSSNGESMTPLPGEMIGLRQQCQIAFSPHYG
ncbi:unnamed protein product, partial [Strongylus vulgaris]